MHTQDAQYYENQQCSQQWRAFLTAFATQFSAKGDLADLRGLMHELGRTMAKQTPLAGGNTLDALQAEMNRIWQGFNWGWVEIVEEADALVVVHHLAPFKLAFGTQALGWSPALLEGVYAQWFDSLGMDPTLELNQRGEVEQDGTVFVYELKKKREETSYFTRR